MAIAAILIVMHCFGSGNVERPGVSGVTGAQIAEAVQQTITVDGTAETSDAEFRFASIQLRLAAAERLISSGVPVKVRIMPGIYRETARIDFTEGRALETLRMKTAWEINISFGCYI